MLRRARWHQGLTAAGGVACALVATGCQFLFGTDDDARIYVAAGSSDNGVTLSVVRASRLSTVLSISAPAGHQHLSLVRDQSSGRLIWLHGRNGGGWAAEILSSDLRRLAIRRDTAILAGHLAGRYVVPTADPWGTITESGLVVLPVRGLPALPTDTVIDGLLVLSAADLSFRGLIPGLFANFQMVPSGLPCCVVAYGTRDAIASRLYEVDVEGLVIVDSFVISAGPDAVHIPGSRRVALGGNGVVEIYDLAQHQSVALRTVSTVGGPMVFDPTASQLLVAGDRDVVALDPTSLSELWRIQLVPNHITQDLATLTVASGGTVLVGGTAPPPLVFSHETHLVAARIPVADSPQFRRFWGLPWLFSW